jgi:hypothetical protein
MDAVALWAGQNNNPPAEVYGENSTILPAHERAAHARLSVTPVLAVIRSGTVLRTYLGRVTK